ncbi:MULTISPECIES: DMT family transporter [unclassified Spirillospora]|uniref:DMT family transporter n=1 Tax=unclassified Spirillospora TaxID=2642701 RepID=UPI00370FE6C0
MAWVFLLIASMMELVWAVALKQPDGFTRFWPTFIGLSVALFFNEGTSPARLLCLALIVIGVIGLQAVES